MTGSRGSGKTSWTMRQVGADELLVWDSVGEWTRARMVNPVRSLRELHAYVVQADLAPVRLGYVGPMSVVVNRKPVSLFPIFCALAWVWLRMRRGRVLVVEELADVTSPGKAPAAWGEIVRKGRHQGGRIYALTQRPAESDKTIAGNADIIHAGRQSFPRDRKSMAEYLDVPELDVTNLRSLEWIERDMRTRELTRGTVKF